jgi:ubiquinone/menaquinone biosynthesis C-methylase UbiE
MNVEPEPAATRRQRRVYGKQAARYDERISRLESKLLAGTREWIGARASGRVLEVAVGTGRSLPFYSREVRPIGVDLSPDMLALARRRASELGVDAELREGDAESLPFEDESFDTVVCALGLCSIPRPRVAIAEMRRVLRPGGSLVLVDHVRSSWPPVVVGQWIGELFSIPLEGDHLTRRHLAEVRDAGLEVVEHERLKLGVMERIRATKTAA